MKNHRIPKIKIYIVRATAPLVIIACIYANSSSQAIEGRNSAGEARLFSGRYENLANTPDNNPSSDRTNLDQSFIVEGKDVTGRVGQSILLDFTITQPTNVQIRSIKITGLPPEFSLTDATHSLKTDHKYDIIDLSGWDLSDIHVTQHEGHESHFYLSIFIEWKSKFSDKIGLSSAIFSVSFLNKSEPFRHGESAKADEAPSALGEPMQKLGTAGSSSRPAVQIATSGSNAITVEESPIPAFGESGDADGKRMGPGGAVNAGASASVPRPSSPPPRAADSGPLVERARSLIGRGDISGARLVLERARARNEPNATLLLAQTWDPKILRRWNVRGLQPDPERAEALYSEAAKQGQADDRLLAATRR